MILLLAIPLILRISGIFCENRDNRVLQCAATASAVFIICGLPGLSGLWDSWYAGFGAQIRDIPFDKLGELAAPPAETLLMKICAAFSDDSAVYPLVMACICALLASYAVKETPYHSSAVLCFVFIPAFLFSGSAFIAALICTIASVYIRERRFFRYAALILIAACFDMSALMMLPFWFLTLIPGPVIPAVIAVIFALLAGLFPEMLDAVYDMTGARTIFCETPVMWAVLAVIAALVCILMYAMFRNREGKYERLLPIMFCGAALTVTAVSDARLFAPAIMLLMQSAVPLAEEAYAISSKFVGIVFKEKEKTARNVFLALCVIAETALCAWMIFTDWFGTAGQFDAALKWTFGL